MNITGAELIIRFLQNRPKMRGSYAVATADASLRTLQLELEAAELVAARADEAAVLFVDLRKGWDDVALTTVAQAKSQRRAVLCIAVQVRRNLIGSDACRPAQIHRLFESLTKAWFHVGAAMELLELLPQALHLAGTARRGPVLLEIPEDVLLEVMQSAWIPRPLPSHTQSLPFKLQYA